MGEIVEWRFKLYNGNKLIDKIYPKFNRLVIFEVNDNSIHGFPEHLKCPSDVFRRSVNVYYVTDPSINECKRPRAYFLPGPLDENNNIINTKKWGEKEYKMRDDYLANKSQPRRGFGGSGVRDSPKVGADECHQIGDDLWSRSP